MADFTLNAPGTTNNPWTPANIITPTGGLKSDATGFRCIDSPPGTPGSFAHNVAYGPVIEATFTLATAGAAADDLMGGAVVRTGANAGALIGVWIESGLIGAGTLNPAGTFTSVSSSVTITRAASDVWDVTVSISGGTATITCKQNGTPITFNINTTTTYATESSLAAGGNFSPFDNNTLYLSQFTGTGVNLGLTITPPVGSETISGNTPTVVSGTNTVLSPAVARHGGILKADRRLLVPRARTIFLPVRKAA